MTENKRATRPAWTDPDDAPELTDAWFDGAERHSGGVLVRRGRPPLDQPKRAISLRIDADVLERFRASGSGWQARMNAALRKSVGL